MCWFSIYFEISFSLLHVALVDPVVCFSCAAPVDPVVGVSREITTIGIRARYLKMSAIKFDIQKFNDIINFSRWQIRMNAILTRSGLKKALLQREKKPQDMKRETWQELDEKGRSWMRKPSWLFSFTWRRSVGWVFYRENNVLAVGATLGSLSEEIIGKLADSEAACLSSPRAWRYTYRVSHCITFLYYQWSR